MIWYTIIRFGNPAAVFAGGSLHAALSGQAAAVLGEAAVVTIATRWLVCSYDTTPCDPTQAPTFPPAATGTIKALEGTSAAAPSVPILAAPGA